MYFFLIVVPHDCDSNIWEVKMEWPGVQGHSQVSNKVKASLGYKRPSAKSKHIFLKKNLKTAI